MKTLQPSVWILQETKLRANETILCESLNEFCVYYLNRQYSQGGGVALGVRKEFQSALIKDGDDETEAISVKLFVKEFPVRIVAAYGPQENAVIEKKQKFWEFIENEANQAELEGDGLIIQMDGNLHAGKDLIKGDPNKQNKNGKLFAEFLDRNKNLIVVNNLDTCEGLITRKREFKDKTEEAILDFMIINDKLRPFVKEMKIDEKKQFKLINLAQLKRNNKFIETDHNSLVLDLKINGQHFKMKREEMFNLRNKASQEAFFKETQQNQELLKCFDGKSSFENKSKKWKRNVDRILQKCFRRVRIIKKKKETKTEQLLLKRVKYKNDLKSSTIKEEMKMKIRQRIKQIEDDIGDEVAYNNFKDVVETIKELGEDVNMNGSGRRKLWDLLKKKFPKTLNVVPVGKIDSRGSLVTKHEDLKHLYLKTYENRMRNRPIKENLVDIKDMKNELFNIRLKIATNKKSKAWDMKDLETALRALKKDKARDPHGWINELFMD